MKNLSIAVIMVVVGLSQLSSSAVNMETVNMATSVTVTVTGTAGLTL